MPKSELEARMRKRGKVGLCVLAIQRVLGPFVLQRTGLSDSVWNKAHSNASFPLLSSGFDSVSSGREKWMEKREDFLPPYPNLCSLQLAVAPDLEGAFTVCELFDLTRIYSSLTPAPSLRIWVTCTLSRFRPRNLVPAGEMTKLSPSFST